MKIQHKKLQSNTDWNITPEVAECRDSIACTLRTHGAFLIWHPHTVDHVLNCGHLGANIDDLCAIASQDPIQSSLTKEDLRNALNGMGRPMDKFLRSRAFDQIRKLDFKLDASLIDEIMEMVWDRVVDLAPRYTPSSVSASGEYCSLGYQPYLITFTRDLARSIIPRVRERLAPRVSGERTELDDHVFVAEVVPHRCDSDLRDFIIGALKSVLKAPLHWEFFFQTVYKEVNLRDFAKRIGVPKSSVSRNLSQGILSSLQRRLSPIAPDLAHGAVNFVQVSAVVPAFLSEAEFVTAIPHPVTK